MPTKQKKEKRKASVWKQLTTSLLGLRVCIIRGSSKDWEGIHGIIRDETYNLLKIETENKLLLIPKAHQIFEIEIKEGEKFLVEGHLLVGNPEHRIKKKLKTW